ncbi:MAG: HAD family hydrolase [Candidatus Eremiobacteraeota bacterium]|nr:HAD family hydrolase [Candidatus Eremiobacteraeota bacterium]
MRAAFGFDFDHTLGFDHRLERVAFLDLVREIAQDTGVSVDEHAAQKVIDRQIGAFRAGRSDLDSAIASAFAQVLFDTSPPDGAQRFRHHAVGLVPRYVTAAPGATELLAAMAAAGVPFAMLTNGWNPLQTRKAEQIGFDRPVLVSEDLGVRKPQPEAFTALASRLGVSPADILYVGDDPEVDVAGALTVGMRAIWMQREGALYPADQVPPTATVRSLIDVLQFIG